MDTGTQARYCGSWSCSCSRMSGDFRTRGSFLTVAWVVAIRIWDAFGTLVGKAGIFGSPRTRTSFGRRSLMTSA